MFIHRLTRQTMKIQVFKEGEGGEKNLSISEVQTLKKGSLTEGLVGGGGGVHRSDQGHKTHSADRRAGQLSVQVRERKTSRVAASRLLTHADALKGSIIHSLNAFLPSP